MTPRSRTRAAQVARWVDPLPGPAHDAPPSGDGAALSAGGRHGRCPLERRRSPQRSAGAQSCAPAKRGSLHGFSYSESVEGGQPMAAVVLMLTPPNRVPQSSLSLPRAAS